MEKRRRKRSRYTSLEKLLSLLIGGMLGLLASLGHVSNIQQSRPVSASLPAEPLSITVTLGAPETPAVLPEPYNDPNIPDDVEEAARTAGEAYGLSPELLEAVAYYESRYQPDAVNGDCTGLMQVSLYWHRDRMERMGVTEADMWETGPNMMVAADYLAELLQHYDDLGAALMYYNGGHEHMTAYLERNELSNYASSVITLAAQLRQEHDSSEGGGAMSNKK